jgi:hypothetical protein
MNGTLEVYSQKTAELAGKFLLCFVFLSFQHKAWFSLHVITAVLSPVLRWWKGCVWTHSGVTEQK